MQISYEKALKRLQSPELTNRGVFYDGGFKKEQTGVYYLNKTQDYISVETFQRLRMEGILGGNTLRTYKAKRWHPVLDPGQQDKSKLGDDFYHTFARFWGVNVSITTS